MDDLVSVIIPYYKKRKFISETVDSAVNQSYKNLEIIIIYDDDDKTDLDFVRKIAKKDNRIKIIVNREKMGAGISRNIGILESKGKYIAFLDADDIWQLDKLKKIGGVDSIVPSEGLVFKYKGKTYKFTGAFAPINQITGLISF